jgi:hypothetical protein
VTSAVRKLKVEMGTKAWCKVFEILVAYQLEPPTPECITVHLCEAPGAFITATKFTKLGYEAIERVNLDMLKYHPADGKAEVPTADGSAALMSPTGDRTVAEAVRDDSPPLVASADAKVRMA